VRTQQEAEAIVDVENIQNKYETSVLANNYSQEPKTYEEAMCTGVSTRLHCMRVEEVFMNNEAVDLMIHSL
jgi:hypothetical protein